jgi:hypothetical protein
MSERNANDNNDYLRYGASIWSNNDIAVQRETRNVL